MKMKKLVSAIAALAMSVSAFAGLTAYADETMTLTPVADTYVVSGDTTDYSSATELRAVSGSKVALLQFDSSELVKNGLNVISATLNFNIASRAYNSGRSRWESSSIVLQSADADLSAVTYDSWNALTKTTISNKVQWSSNDASTASDGVAPYAARSFDVTDALVADADGIITFGITTGTAREQAIAALEDASNAATLVIVASAGYSATVEGAAAFAKVDVESASGTATYYTDASGSADLGVYSDGTVLSYTISKGGYTSSTGNITINGGNATVTAPMAIADENTLYVEDFETAATDTAWLTSNTDTTSYITDGKVKFVNTNGNLRCGYKTFAVDTDGTYDIDTTVEFTAPTGAGSATRTEAISFRDGNNNVIFGIAVAEETAGEADYDLYVYSGNASNDKVNATDYAVDNAIKLADLESGAVAETKVNATVNTTTGVVKVTVGSYETVTFNVASLSTTVSSLKTSIQKGATVLISDLTITNTEPAASIDSTVEVVGTYVDGNTATDGATIVGNATALTATFKITGDTAFNYVTFTVNDKTAEGAVPTISGDGASAVYGIVVNNAIISADDLTATATLTE